MLENLDGYSSKVEIFPLVKYYMNELKLFELFKKYVPKGNADLEPASVLCLMIVNILDSNRPLYKVEEWLADYADGVGEAIVKASKYNDDRLARSCIDGLYNADRNSLITSISANAIMVYNLETKCILNDTTTITLHGAYNRVSPAGTVKPARGYNKDGHPSFQQIVFGLNITTDGYVPISYRALNGDTSDSDTHIPNWNLLRQELSKIDFIYVADSKLCVIENLAYIADAGGKFITMMPASRNEVKDFYEHLASGEKIPWQLGYQKENSRKRGDFTTYRVS
jgi:transposase